jgi:hypothetical protein
MRRWFKKHFRRKRAGAAGSGQGAEGHAAGGVRGAEGQARGAIVNFHTERLEAGRQNDVHHVIAWASSTGRASDIGHLRTREMVTWAHGAPPEFAPSNNSEYTRAGQHTGLGGNVGNNASVCRNDDSHSIVPVGFTMDGALADGQQSARWTMQQVYQYAEEGSDTWHAIRCARYSITRWIARDGDARIVFCRKQSEGEHPPVTCTASVRI